MADATKFCRDCGAEISERAEICPKCGVRQENHAVREIRGAMAGQRSKLVAGLLGILLGGVGIHKFYLGRVGWGILYLVFCWTFIPAVVGFIEGVIYLVQSEENFAAKYS